MSRLSRIRVWCAPIFLFVFTLWMSGCGNAIPVGSTHGSTTVPSDDGSRNDDASSPKDILTAQVRIAGSWSTPAKIASETANSATSDMLHGPQLAGDGSGNVFADWRLHTDLDAQTGAFSKGTNKLYRYAPPAAWATSSPGAAANLDNASKFDVVVNRQTGDGYAAWREGAHIKVNHYVPGTGWNTASEDAGTGSWAYLANAVDNGTTLVVGEVDKTANRTVMRVMRYDGMGWVLDENTLTRDTTSVVAARPAMFASASQTEPGALLISWTETLADGGASLWAAAYTSIGWSTPVKISETGAKFALISSPNILLDNSAATAQLLYFAGATADDGIFYIATYDATNGWGSPRVFDAAQKSPRKASSDISVSVDDRGNAVVAWREETVISGINVNGIYTRTYTSKKGWNVVRRASALGRTSAGPAGSVTSLLHSPQVKLNASSVMALTWIEDSAAASEVLVSYADFAANPLWPLATDLVVLYNTRGVKAEQPQIALNDSNGLVVAWRQATTNSTGTNYTLWSSVKGTQQGQAVDVVLNPSPTPQPNPSPLPANHATLTTGCINCHNGTSATGKPVSHIASKDSCASCHRVTAWRPVVKVNHDAVIGTCVSCHNNVKATGKPVTHIAATDKCDACHDKDAKFKPVVKINHAEILGDCVSCHNSNTANTAKPATHIAATDACQLCHRSLTGGTNGAPIWIPVLIDHTQTLGTCVSCHDGATIKGKPSTHLPTNDKCDACHRVTAFAPALGFDHAQTSAACVDCHNGNIAGVSGKSANHVETTDACSTCHTTAAWRPAVAGGGSGGSGGSTGGGSGTINGTWGTPVNAATIDAPSNTVTVISGPALAWGKNGTGFISLRKRTGFDFSTGQFTSNSEIVKYYDATGQSWVTKNPVPASQNKTAEDVKIASYGDKGAAYALWKVGGDLYFNAFDGTKWGTALKLAIPGTSQYELHVAPGGEAAVLTATQTEVSLIRYSPASGNTAAVWGDVASFTATIAMELGPVAAMDSAGNIAVAYVGHDPDIVGANDTWKIQTNFNAIADGAWAGLTSAKDVLAGAVPRSIHLAMHQASPNPLLILQVDGGGNARGGALYSSMFDGSAWGMWENIDYNAVGSVVDQVVGQPVVAYNHSGDIVILWAEKETIRGTTSYHLFSNYLEAESTAWGEPKHVSMTSALATMSAVEESQPAVKIDDDGHVTAVWVASDGVTSKLLSNHYHKVATATNSQTGWNMSPEMVVSYDIETDGYVLNPRVGTDANEKAVTTWKQVVRQQFSFDYKIWSSVVP